MWGAKCGVYGLRDAGCRLRSAWYGVQGMECKVWKTMYLKAIKNCFFTYVSVEFIKIVNVLKLF